MAKICIDARFWGIEHTGIGRYIENLIDNLPDNVVLIVPPKLKNEPKLARFHKYYAHFHVYSFLAQLEMFWILTFIRPDLLHIPHFMIPVLWPGKMVVTIHDLIKHQSTGPATTTKHPLIYWFKQALYLLVVWIAVFRAKHIIVPAKYWREILSQKFTISENRISVTYEGVSKLNSQSDNINLSIGRDQSYVIYVGNVYPHKDVPTLISALKLLEGKVLGVIVCARSIFRSRTEKMIADMGADKYIKFFENVSDPDLAGLYRNSLCFVTPALIEGFGLPGLEAMAAGTPVIAAHASCLPEIYGDAAIFFTPKDPSDLASKISDLESHPQLRKDYIAKGLKLIKKYSWSKMAKQTWDVYQRYV